MALTDQDLKATLERLLADLDGATVETTFALVDNEDFTEGGLAKTYVITGPGYRVDLSVLDVFEDPTTT